MEDPKARAPTMLTLVGGGLCPGINNVIKHITLSIVPRGWRSVGLLNGFDDVRSAGRQPQFVDLTPDSVSGIGLSKGSILFTGRGSLVETGSTACADHAASVLDFVDALAVIGGEDTLSSAACLAAAFRRAARNVRIIHIPKTIDNDLALPDECPTFGFRTAVEEAANQLDTMAVDARDCRNRWFIVVLQGRNTGHLALHSGLAAKAPLIYIPEMFAEKIPLNRGKESLIDMIFRGIAARHARGINAGVVVLSEGVYERLDDASKASIKGNVTFCEHGHTELANIPFGFVVAELVAARLKAAGLKLKVRDDKIGFDVRVIPPSETDQQYTAALACGAVNFLLKGESEATVYMGGSGVELYPFASMFDASGKARVRKVNLDSYRKELAETLATMG